MSITNLLRFSYWFSVHTPPFGRVAFIITLVVLGALLGIAIVLRVFARQYTLNPLLVRGLLRSTKPFFFSAILGLVLTAFRQLGAAVLSARFWMVLVLGVGIAWFGMVFYKLRGTYDAEYARLQAEKKYKEYLPKRRK